MKYLHRFLIILLLLSLTACGAIIRIDGISIQIPEREELTASPTIAPSATRTVSPTATNRPTNTATARPSATASPTIQLAPDVTTLVGINLRSAASINSSILTVIPANTTIALFGRSADSAWLSVQYGAHRGWVSSANNLVRINRATLPSLPIYIPPAPTATPTAEDSTPTREIRIGYNINGEAVPSMSYLLETVTSPCGTLQLVMNNLGLARQIKDRCPDTHVVSRNYSPLEGGEWALRSPQQIVAVWIAEGNRDIIRHSTNEPSFGRGRRLEEFVAKDCELMKLARAAGFTVAMGNFSVGIFEPEDINAGLFDPYLYCLEIYGHYLALHEYSVAVLPFGVGRWSTAYLLDRAFVQPASWPRAAELPTCPNGGLGSYWYLMRGTWWLCRADTIGVPRPRILVTEFGWDNLPNIKSYIEPLRQQFGIDRYFDDMRGVNTYVNLWAYYYPQWSFAQAACEQLKWADSIYPPEYIGFALFTWSTNPHWLQTDFSGFENPAHRDLHTCLETYAFSLN